MEFKSQICTTKEQSERLLALGLKKETSDMCMDTIMGYVYTYPCKYIEDTHPNWHLTPLWSLHRLIEMTPTTVPDKSNIIHYLTSMEQVFLTIILVKKIGKYGKIGAKKNCMTMLSTVSSG